MQLIPSLSPLARSRLLLWSSIQSIQSMLRALVDRSPNQSRTRLDHPAWCCTRWGQFLANVGERDLFVGKQINLLEIVVVLLLLLLLLLAVDLEVETSKMPLLWTHTSLTMVRFHP